MDCVVVVGMIVYCRGRMDCVVIGMIVYCRGRMAVLLSV